MGNVGQVIALNPEVDNDMHDHCQTDQVTTYAMFGCISHVSIIKCILAYWVIEMSSSSLDNRSDLSDDRIVSDFILVCLAQNPIPNA